jgi:alcohol dehydrogenase (NADP+)
MHIPTFTLRDGGEMPAIGLGTWQAEPGVVGEAVLSAIKCGYRHFDCSPIYGNEKEIGEAFSAAFGEGLVKREELFIASKLWCDCHERQHVLPGLRQTLSDLQIDYLDLYLIHWPIALRHGKTFPQDTDDFLAPSEAPLAETWGGMEESRSLGLTRHIGVSNVSAARLGNLMAAASHAPEVNQVECHPFLAQEELRKTCKKHGVVLTAYCPLGSGKEKDGDTPDIFKSETLAKIADAHICSPAQVALAWAIGRGTVAIPKSTNETRQKENLAAAFIHLTPEQMAEIDALDQGYRFIDGSFWTKDGSPYSLEWLWQGGEIS